jgi:hypothetical protein
MASEHTNEREQLRVMRRAMEHQLELMLEVLDALDGDPYREDDDPGGGDVNDEGELALGWGTGGQARLTAHEDGETSLGWANQGSQLRLHAEPVGDEAEEHDPGEDTGDYEPWLAGYSYDTTVEGLDREQDTGDDEPTLGWASDGSHGGTYGDGESEPSLGSTSDTDQVRAWRVPVGWVRLNIDVEEEHDGSEPEENDEEHDGREPEEGLVP